MNVSVLIMNMEYRRANKYRAVFLFFFSRKKFIDVATNHHMAINLEVSAHPEIYPIEKRLPIEKATAIDNTRIVSKGLLNAFCLILLTAIIALGVGYVLGSIKPSLPFDFNLLATFIGTFLVGWATLMELGGGFATISHESLHELIHQLIFKILFIPGVCLLLLGVVI